MASREELKALLDQIPESRLDPVRRMLEHHIHLRPPGPEIELMQRRSQDYKRLVERRFSETGTPGTMGSMGGERFAGMQQGTPFGRQSFSYWDKRALVHQTLQLFDDQEIEVMERLSLSPDRTKLLCSLEIASGGHTVRHEDEFPITHAEARP